MIHEFTAIKQMQNADQIFEEIISEMYQRVKKTKK